jgi:hypothetical protein
LSRNKEYERLRMIYEIIYHVGPEINLKTKVKSGTLIWLEKSAIISESPTQTYELLFTSIQTVEMFRLHGLGRMIKLVCKDKTIIFLTVTWFSIAGYFAVINFFKTGELFRKLKSQIPSL